MTGRGLEPAVRQVVDDLQPDAAVVIEAGSGVTVAVTVDDELVCVAYAEKGVTPGELALHVANVVQDAATERLGRAVPDCPGHSHPAVARAAGDGVEWVCPAASDAGILPPQ